MRRTYLAVTALKDTSPETRLSPLGSPGNNFPEYITPLYLLIDVKPARWHSCSKDTTDDSVTLLDDINGVSKTARALAALYQMLLKETLVINTTFGELFPTHNLVGGTLTLCFSLLCQTL